MKKVYQKLHNRSGASVLMALFVLLVAVLASTLVFRAAMSNAGRLKPGAQEEQAYLTVSSAAALFRDELESAGYSWLTVTYFDDAAKPTGENKDKVSLPATLAFGPVLNEMIEEIHGGAPDSSRTLTLTLSSDEGRALDSVTVNVKMDADYNVSADFRLTPVPGRDLDNRVHLSANPTITNSSQTGITAGGQEFKRVAEELKYNSAVISKGGNA